jgi:predicted DNA-binding mobile mystery protein A
MRAADRAVARINLDKQLNSIRISDSFARPPKGWVRAIREALGMTTAQLGKRIGVTQSRAFDIEKAEVSGKITLDSLARAAHALDCRLVYALVPREPLESIAEDRALKLARKKLRSTSHHMAPQDQRVNRENEERQIEDLAGRLLEKPGSALWDEE